jgi:predicted GIY-YIG superfamily endonuclease
MSFTECAARSFTFVSVQKNAPESPGVYGLSNGREWIFIGEAANIRERLLEHLEEAGTALTNRKPTGFTFEKCSNNDRLSRQDALVRQFEPFCNRSADYAKDRVHRKGS